MRNRSFAALTLAAGLLLAAGLPATPATADWLVTRQGDRIETRGPWQEKGKLVVFHTADGRLSSLRLADVDLAASRAATSGAVDAERARTEAKPAPAPAPLREAHSITDADVAHVREETPAPAPEADSAKDQPAARPADLEVGSWERSRADDGHVVITGTLRNTSSMVVAGVRLIVHLVDETGAEIAAVPAQLPSSALRAGQQVDFRADFPNVFGFADAQLEPQGVRLRSSEPPPSTESSALR